MYYFLSSETPVYFYDINSNSRNLVQITSENYSLKRGNTHLIDKYLYILEYETLKVMNLNNILCQE